MDGTRTTGTSAGGVLQRLLGTIRRHWGAVAGITTAIVTVATIVIPLVADATVRFTSVETLAVNGVVVGETAGAEPPQDLAPAASTIGLGSAETINSNGRSAESSWRVRSDAPFDTFPLATEMGAEACNAEQVAWLEQWGRRSAVEIWNGYLTLSNVAADGGSMSIRNIHSVGTFVTPEVPEVAVECSGGIGGGSELVAMRQLLGSDQAATLVSEYNGLPAGSPVVLNIAPGEFVQTVTYFDRPADQLAADFVGSLVADVDAGGVSSQVTLFEGFTRIAAPEITTTTLRIIGPSVLCGPDGGWDECTIPMFLEQMTADPGYER